MAVTSQIGSGTLGDELAVAQDIPTVGARQREVDVLLDEEDRELLLARQAPQERQQVLDDHRRETRAHLVD
ncbi:MAG TPA: hypothetical protein VHS57_00795, partial [Acidimicrobiales bacterium]|nr:hypothetical protein [Acidimicrobiales bacterium]